MKAATRILILDDERIVCDRLRLALEKLGFVVETYTEGTKAVARLAEQRFDILVTDLKMPGICGMDIVTFARGNCPSTKVIVITGFATTDTAEQALAQGAVEFIPKPFKMSYLRDLIVRLAAAPRGESVPPKRNTP